MKDGRVVGELPAADADVPISIILWSAGHCRPSITSSRFKNYIREEIFLESDGLSLGNAYRDVSLKLHQARSWESPALLDPVARS